MDVIGRFMTRIALVALVLVFAAACSDDPPPPIQHEGGRITVLNQTSRDWQGVRVVVNGHFFGGVPRLEAGGRLDAPLSQFTTGFGQRYEPRFGVKTIEVTATDSAGEPVTLRWPGGAPAP